MEFLEVTPIGQVQDKAVVNILASLDGLTIEQAGVSAKINRTKINVEDISSFVEPEPINYSLGKSPLIDFNPLK